MASSSILSSGTSKKRLEIIGAGDDHVSRKKEKYYIKGFQPRRKRQFFIFKSR